MVKLFVLCLTLALLCVVDVMPQSRRRITAKVRQEIVQQMVRDGQIESSCVEAEGGALKVVNINPVDLNRDGKPEYEIYGEGCACNGMRRCNQWLYRQTASGYELLLDPVQVDGFDVKKSQSNGYPDIAIATPAGDDYFVELYKYDGSRYQVRVCEVCKYVGKGRGSSTHQCRRVECRQ